MSRWATLRRAPRPDLATGTDVRPAAAASRPLGAGRHTRARFAADQPGRALRARLAGQSASVAHRLGRQGLPGLAVGTTATFRLPARAGLGRLISFGTRMLSRDLGERASGAHQIDGGVLVTGAREVAELGMAQHEGVSPRRPDLRDGMAQTDRS